MPHVLADGARLNYVQLEPEGPVRGDVVLVHGLATNLAFWYFQYAVALAEKYRVTVFDLRGHGRSTMTESGYRVDALGEDLHALLRQLNIPHAHLVGHSFGGVVALSFAARHPERVASLVLADVQTTSTRNALRTRHWQHGEVLQKLFKAHDIPLDPRDPFFGFEALTQLSRLIVDRGSLPESILRLVSPLLGKQGSRTAKQWLQLLQTTRAGDELRQDDGLSRILLQDLRFPILTIYGSRSQAFVAKDQLLELWPQAELRVIEDAGHFFPASHVNETLAELCRFWEPRQTLIVPRDRLFDEAVSKDHPA